MVQQVTSPPPPPPPPRLLRPPPDLWPQPVPLTSIQYVAVSTNIAHVLTAQNIVWTVAGFLHPMSFVEAILQFPAVGTKTGWAAETVAAGIGGLRVGAHRELRWESDLPGGWEASEVRV